jgi:hypothetical protein
MYGQQKLQIGSAGRLNIFGVGKYLHSLCNGMDTGGHQIARPPHLYHTHAASANLIHFFQVA